MTRTGAPRRRYIGGRCKAGHLLTPENVYVYGPTKRVHCQTCAEILRAKKRRTRDEPPTERPCGRCGVVLPISAYRTPGTQMCDRCRYTMTNATRCGVARAATRARRDEAATVIAFCRTGVARLRLACGWDADRVARSLGVPPGSFVAWLGGRRLPQPRRVAGLAEGMVALLAMVGGD